MGKISIEIRIKQHAFSCSTLTLQIRVPFSIDCYLAQYSTIVGRRLQFQLLPWKKYRLGAAK